METENSENIDFENISEEQKQILERLNTLNNDDPLQPGTHHLHHHRLLSLLLQVRGDQLESDDAANQQ